MISEAEIEPSHRPPPSLTAESIILLAQDPFATLPTSANPAALLDLLDSASPAFPVSAFLSALLSLISRSTPSPSLLSSLLLSFLRLFHSRRFPRHDAALVIRLFTPHLSSLDRSQLPFLLDLIVADLSAVADPDDALLIDLLPGLLELTGCVELVDQAVEKLLAADWSKPLLLKIVALLREIPAIGRGRISEFLDKVFLGMKGVDLQDLPSLVYQLLLLASKGINRREVVRGIVGFFGGFSKGPPSIMRQVEGTILMHVNFAVKQDPSLGQEVLAVIRSDIKLLNHFAVAVLLSVSRVRRFSESSLGILRTAVTTSHRDYKISRDCKWLPDSLKEECFETAKCVEKSLLKAVNESNSGREHAVPSIVQFGFLLLESAHSEKSEQVPVGLISIEELSIQILKTLFEVHDMSRNEIIEQCKFRVLSLKPHKSMAIIKLLSNLVQSYPYPMLECIAHLKEILDYYTFLQEETAIALTDALFPLLRFSCDLQDYIILVVRKAMFKREDTIRRAAIVAVINLITVHNKFKKNGLNSMQDSSSQASCSQQADIPCRRGVGLFYELSGLLRRCLTQQARVREIFYKGLVKLITSEPSIRRSILDILWPHFLQIYIEDKDFLLQIEACFKLENGKVHIVEPLDSLLSCVCWILHARDKSEHQSEDPRPCFDFSLSQENEAGKATSVALFSNALVNIRRNLTNYKLQVAERQKEHSSGNSLQEEKSNCKYELLCRIIEVVVNIVALDLEKAVGEEKVVLEKEIMKLSELYHLLEKESSKNTHRSGNRKGSSRELLNKVITESKECAQLNQGRTFFATSAVHHLLLTAINSYKFCISSSHQTSQKSNDLSTADHYLKMLSLGLKVCLSHLNSVDTLKSEGSGDPFGEMMSGEIRCLGKPLMQLAWLIKASFEQEKDPKKKDGKGKTSSENKGDQLLLSLLCLNELFKINSSGPQMYELAKDLLSIDASDLQTIGDAVEDIDPEKSFLDEYQNMKWLHQLLEKRIEPLYSSLVDMSLLRECEVLAELLLIIGNKLPPAQRKSHGSWAMSICERRKIERPSSARSLLSLAIYLVPPPIDLIVAHDMATELLKVLGSEDKDPEDTSERFPVINRATKNAIATVILQVAESCLVDMDWAVSKVKAISACNPEQSGLRTRLQFGEKLSGHNLEEVLYARSELLVHLLSSFVQMNLKDSQAEQVLKIATRFYKILALTTKLRIAPKGSKQLFLSPKFQKLSDMTCTKLTSPLYNFVALVQRNQQQSAQQKTMISKIKRENRCIPDLIFQIEDYEKYLIQLSKLSKINLLRNAKRSTARDFKILEMEKVPVEEEAREHEPSGSGSPSESENESSGKSEHANDENIPEKFASPEPSGDIPDEDSENDKDDQELLVRRKKRIKLSKVVEDSDEE